MTASTGLTASRRFPVVDHVVERDIRLRLRGALFSGDIPTPRDATLTGLVGACGVPGKSSRIMTWRGSAIGWNCCAGLKLVTREIPGAISDIEYGVRSLAATPGLRTAADSVCGHLEARSPPREMPWAVGLLQRERGGRVLDRPLEASGDVVLPPLAIGKARYALTIGVGDNG